MAVNKQSGQALLLVVLVMVVALTVGLSLGSRSIVNIRTSTEEADSQKALAAAEAGIEQALQEYQSATIAESFIENNTTYNAEIKEVEGTTFLANGGDLVVEDDGIDIWLVSHNPDGKPNFSTPWTGKDLNIYWGDPSLGDDCKNAAIEVAVISGSKASPVLTREAFDPCTSRKTTNKFSTVGGGGPYTIEGKRFMYRKQNIDAEDGLVARVVPIYTSTPIAVEGDIALPTQGFAINSTGTSGAGGDRQVLRSITFFRTFDELPTPYFMYGLFSPWAD